MQRNNAPPLGTLSVKNRKILLSKSSRSKPRPFERATVEAMIVPRQMLLISSAQKRTVETSRLLIMAKTAPLTRRFPFLRKIQTRFREDRIRLFLEQLQPKEEWQILDVGGTPKYWAYQGMTDFKATLLNLHEQQIDDTLSDRITAITGSGMKLEFPDKSFDLVLSNSVIEHVGTWENQQAFAAEALRVGRQIWVQTPAQEFFLEPHYMAPFIHWFPKAFRGKIARHFTPWGIVNRPDKALVERALKELRLLKKEEMHTLFPGCEIIVERFMGMPKSYTAIIK